MQVRHDDLKDEASTLAAEMAAAAAYLESQKTQAEAAALT